MKTFILLASFLLCFSIAKAQEDSTKVTEPKKWKLSGTPGVSFAQNSFSNWVGGGADMYAITFDSKVYADYKDDRRTWNNFLNLGYGFNRQKVEGTRKLIDKMELNTALSIKGPNEIFRYSASVNLKSQFTEGYDYRSVNQWYLTSSFFAPGYITAAVGVDYIGTKNLVVSLFPLSEKTTVVTDSYYDKKVVNVFYDGYEPEFTPEGGESYYYDQKPSDEQLNAIEEQLDSTVTTYGLAWRENTRFETGLKIVAVYEKENLLKNLGFKTRLEVFSSYSNFMEPDINWETWISFKFNKNFSFNINPELIYDSDMLNEKGKAKMQFRNFMGIGASYTFNN